MRPLSEINHFSGNLSKEHHNEIINKICLSMTTEIITVSIKYCKVFKLNSNNTKMKDFLPLSQQLYLRAGEEQTAKRLWEG